MRKIPLYKKCERCRGTGITYYHDYTDHHSTAMPSPRADICKKCNGTGYEDTDHFINADDLSMPNTWKNPNWDNFESEPE